MMKRVLSLLVAVWVSMAVWAGAWTPENLPIPANTYDSTAVSYVSNPDYILSDAEVDSINALFFQMEKNQGVRGLVIVVKEIDPDDPYEFTITVANKHGIGGKASTGIVVMLATESRAYSILTGDGMEKFITDAQCGIIERRDMVPLLKEGQWGLAVYAACSKIHDVVSGQTELNPDEEDSEPGAGNVLLWMGLGFGGLVGAGVYTSRKSRTCSKCKKLAWGLAMRQVELDEDEEGGLTLGEREDRIQERLDKIRSGIKMEDEVYQTPKVRSEKAAKKVRIVDVYRCSECGYEERRLSAGTTYDYKLGYFYGSVLASIIAHSSGGGVSVGGSYRRGGGRSSSGGHSWGSSGGGHFGGGGASGRF